VGREVGEGGLVNVLLTDLSWNCVRLPLAPRVNEEESEEEEEEREKEKKRRRKSGYICLSFY